MTGVKREENGESILENERLLVSVLPDDGGRMVRLFDKLAQCELLWQNPRTSRVRRYYGCCYDDMSAGGVEEAFPTVLACKHMRAELPSFGEVWTLPWQETRDEKGITLETDSLVWPAHLKKVLRLDGTRLCVSYTVENIGTDAFTYLFGFHPALRLYADSRLLCAPGTYQMLCAPDLTQEGELFSWPDYHGRDLRQMQGGSFGGVYNFAMDPAASGYYGVQHPAKQTGLCIRYDASVFRMLSIWPVYGSWRGHTCLLTEAFTAAPLALTQAEQAGSAEILRSGEALQTEVFYEAGLVRGE